MLPRLPAAEGVSSRLCRRPLFFVPAIPRLLMPHDAAAAGAAAAEAVASAVTKLPRTSAKIPADAESNPHHVVQNGRIAHFRNPYPSYKPPDVWKYVIKPRLMGKVGMPDTKPPTVPVIEPKWLPSRSSLRSSDKLRATWLGHACYLVEFPTGLRVLFDPVFETSCSPWPVSLVGPKRYTERPCGLRDLPTVDAVVISHSHYDHLSIPSLMELKKHHPGAQYFVGLGLESWMRARGLENVTEMDWWEDAELTVKVPGDQQGDKQGDKQTSTITARISCLPSQHNSARGLFDKDHTLWASWSIHSGSRSVWFGGDTGYRAVPEVAEGVDDYGPEFESLPRNPQFKQIGELRGPFDLGLIPVGAYSPRAAFSGMHANPFDAVEIFRDTRCRRAMGIHWGTWVLTFEDVLEPPRLLKEALARKGIPEVGVFDVCDIGESREFGGADTGSAETQG